MSDDAPVIPAATLVVMRPAPKGGAPELLIVERSARMAFAAGMKVFPGGRIDREDAELAAALGHPGEAGRIAAIRETLEETALAVGIVGADPARAAGWQAALHTGQAFADLLQAEGLSLDLEALHPFSRWMPRFHQPRRFDTLFFVAEAPPGDWPLHPQAGELTDAEWSTADALLTRVDAGEAGAIFPTKRNLERLARFASVAEAAADADRHGMETIVPWVEEIDGAMMVRIPDNRGYPVTMEPLATAFPA